MYSIIYICLSLSQRLAIVHRLYFSYFFCLLFWRESGAGFTNVRGVSLARKLFVCLILATDLAVVSTLFHAVPSQRANS